MLNKVEAFNQQVRKQVIPAVPTPLTPEQAERAAEAFEEEKTEFLKACESGDVLEAADGIIDLMYFGLGRLAEMGVPAKAVFDGVQAANMQKTTGTLAKRNGWGGYDAVKPEGWKAPDHSFLLNFSLADVEKAAVFNELSPIFQRITYLRAAKGEDYNNVPGGRDAYFPFGHLSYGHMLNTKALRIQSLLNAMMAGKHPNFEGLLDSVEDLVNYGAFYGEWLLKNKVGASA
jgi:predicted HAD superfamily Cof-like phosphohydrolase